MAFQVDWWHTDENGQRIGYMEPTEFEAILSAYYDADRTWAKRFAEQFGFTAAAIYRYAQGNLPIPKHVALIVAMMVKLGSINEVPKLDTPWLPDEAEMEKRRQAFRAELNAKKASKNAKAKKAPAAA
jgi:hypothetical protein